MLVETRQLRDCLGRHDRTMLDREGIRYHDCGAVTVLHFHELVQARRSLAWDSSAAQRYYYEQARRELGLTLNRVR